MKTPPASHRPSHFSSSPPLVATASVIISMMGMEEGLACLVAGALQVLSGLHQVGVQEGYEAGLSHRRYPRGRDSS